MTIHDLQQQWDHAVEVNQTEQTVLTERELERGSLQVKTNIKAGESINQCTRTWTAGYCNAYVNNYG